MHEHSSGIPIHLVHILIGVGVGLALIIPIVFLWRKRYKKHLKATSSVWSEAKTEKLKSDFILNSINDGVVVLDSAGNIQYINPAALTILGWGKEDALGLNYKVILKFVNKDQKDPNEGEPVKDPFQTALQTQQPVRENNALVETKAGKTLTLAVDTSLLMDDKGNKTGGILGVFRDVSEERLDEQRRADFISTASHEMRTPVAAIEGYLALALNDKVSQIDVKARSYLEKAHSSTQHLGKLFQDLLTSAKAEDGRLVNHPVVVEMAAYVEQLADSLRFAAEKKGLLVDFTIGADGSQQAGTAGLKVVKPLYYAQVDPDRMREVITNLFDNAVKYTESGKISLGLTGNKEVIQLYIRDTGPGIPAEDVPHLFQKFYRVDSTATRTIGGTGLGLFICRKIVELYNGRIWVESQVGKGSTFYINLPRLDSARALELQKTETAASPLGFDTPTLTPASGS